MTENDKTELDYLVALVLEASKWKNEDEDSIRLEVESRINRIIESEKCDSVDDDDSGEDDNYEPFPEQDAPLTDEEIAKQRDSMAPSEKWKAGRVRIHYPDGSCKWRLKNECYKIKAKTKGGWRWRWRGDDVKDSQVDKLGDELWKEHENQVDAG